MIDLVSQCRFLCIRTVTVGMQTSIISVNLLCQAFQLELMSSLSRRLSQSTASSSSQPKSKSAHEYLQIVCCLLLCWFVSPPKDTDMERPRWSELDNEEIVWQVVTHKGLDTKTRSNSEPAKPLPEGRVGSFTIWDKKAWHNGRKFRKLSWMRI